MVPIQNSIYMLNEDVLRVVFEFVANIDSPRFMRAKRPLPSSYSLGWIYLSHVCSSWRTISLSMRDLWARDALTIPSALDTFLSRAGKRPLSFELPYILNWDFPPYTNMIECAFDHIHRMEALRSHAPLSWDRYVVLDDATLPLLRTLDITCQSAVFIQKNIHINAPALEIAKVRGMPITFSAPKLRELRLNCPPEPSSALLDMLAGFPLLESLNLSLMMRGLYKSAHPMRSPWSGYSGDIIRLAHLKYMRLVVDDDSDVGTFFSHIRAPPDTLIFVDISLTSEEELDALMRALTPYLRCATYDAIQLREDRTKGTRNFTIFTSAATSPSSSPQGVSLEFRLEENMWKRFISILPEYTDKDRIRHLDFARLSFLGNEAEVKYLRQAFQPFAFVRSVHMNIRMQGSSWDDGFLADFLAPRSGATNVKMFPILTDIAVTMTGVSSASRAPFAKTWQQIIGALERRFSANGPLQRLAVSETWVKDGREDAQMQEISHAARGAARLLVNELVDRC